MIDESGSVFVATRSEDRMWGAMAHGAAFLGLAVPLPGMNVLGPLAVWLAHKDAGGFVEDQARASLNFQISMAILYLATLPFVLLLVGIPVLLGIKLFSVVFVIVAIINAASGKAYAYPFSMELVKPPRPLA